MDDPELSAHRTRSNVRRPTPPPRTIAEIDEAMSDVIEDRS